MQQPFPPPPVWASTLQTVGVTGTNGKTTTTTFAAAALRRLGRPVVRNTTLGVFVDDERLEAPADYYGFLEGMRTCRERGGTHAAIELTSEALAAGFARAWPCSIGVFTNLTRDHLDAHGTPEHYLASKAQLFVHLPPGGWAILHGNDPASELLEDVIAAGVRLVRYGSAGRAHARELHVVLDVCESTWRHTIVQLDATAFMPGVRVSMSLRAIGELYADNAAAAWCAAVCAGVDPQQAADAISEAAAPAGRFEVFGEGPRVVVDFAHTPDALVRTLSAARRLCLGALWVVFGAGGNRDHGKRAAMGEAARLADHVVVTSDNPRNEDPSAIASAILRGLDRTRRVCTILDRAAAIRHAVLSAAPSDVVVVAGKGHEAFQEAAGARVPFRDQDAVAAALQMR